MSGRRDRVELAPAAHVMLEPRARVGGPSRVRSILALAVAAALAVASPGRALANALQNGGFDAPAAAGGVPGWQTQGGDYGTARVVAQPVVSAPGALRLTASAAGSSGDKSLMVFQVLDRTPFLGRKVRFGAQVRTHGAGVNLVLFTPEQAANVLEKNPETGAFVPEAATLDVPQNASMLSFAIQLFGSSGAQAWVDDAYVELDGPAPTPEPTPGAGGAARVQLDAAKSPRNVSPLLFGMHIEWVENGLGLMDPQQDQLRAPVVDLLRPLKIPLLRFPGGIHADYYDWTIGDGPAASRGSAKNVFSGVVEKARFGTPEFVSLLRALGADPLITANYGTGTPAMAAAWAQRFAALGVTPRYWEVGNEIYLSGPGEDGPNGRAIYHAPDQYAHDFPAYRSAIQGVLPDAKVGAIGYIDTGAFALAPADNRDWTTKMLAALTTRADFIAVHDGYAPVILDDSIDFSTDAGRRRAYEALYAGALQTRANLDETDAAIARLSPANKGVPLAVTEFGPFFGVTRDAEMNKAYVDQTRTLAAALYVASVLDTLIGDPRVFMACYTNPIHHWYGSLITDTDAGLVKTPTYYLYQLYRTRFEEKLIATDVVVSPSDAASQVGIVKAMASVPELLAKASVSADGKKLTAILVNRAFDRPLATTIEVKSFAATAADCQVLTAPSAAAINGTALGKTVVSGGAEIRPRALACKATAVGGATTIELSVPPSAVVSVVASS